MTITDPTPRSATLGQELHDFIRQLYPICRSITGDGVRATLAQIGQRIPLQIHEVPSGTQVFDWTVPREWNIRDAYVKNSHGERVIDFRASNLHVVNYSVPVHTRLPLAALREHLHTLPDQPELVPYRTSYYRENWGFCLSQRALDALPDGEYEVCIDSTLEDGHLTYGEYVHQGATNDEILISCHICHPSLCNDNLSGIAVATHLAEQIGATATRYSYRFVFLPATIGAITWLSRNQHAVGALKHGLVLTGVGDAGPLTYKRSRRGNAPIDRALAQVLHHSGQPHTLIDFYPYGYDERQYCSPGFNLPVGCLMRSRHGTFPEYHTSADNLDFVRPDALANACVVVRDALALLERDIHYVNTAPYGEPQLGKRGLYRMLGGQHNSGLNEMALLWVLNLADGQHGLLDMAERAAVPFSTIAQAAAALLEVGLLREAHGERCS